jgi:hypothetical protein
LKKIFKIPNISNHIGVKFIPIFINRTKKRFLVQKMHVPFGPGTYILSGSRDNSYKPPLQPPGIPPFDGVNPSKNQPKQL